MRAICAATEAERPRAIHALFAAYWGRGEDVSEPRVVRAALDAAGLDGAALLAATDDPATKHALRTQTDRAVQRGVFGVPTMFVGDEMFWGQDRLDWVERALVR
jgi:2-hydroxychromene-2-carboxylate isomerase